MYFSELLRHKMFEKIIRRDVRFSFFALLFVLHQSVFTEIGIPICRQSLHFRGKDLVKWVMYCKFVAKISHEDKTTLCTIYNIWP